MVNSQQNYAGFFVRQAPSYKPRRGHQSTMSKLTSKKPAWNKGLKGYYKKSPEEKEQIRQRMLGDKNPAKRPEVAEKIRQHHLKHPISYWKGKKRGDMPWLPKFTEGHKPWNKGRPFLEIRGDKHPNWKGGSKARSLNTFEYRQWRIAVFERDNYMCVMCGKKGYLEADHIRRWADYPELRFDVNNGRTLCKECHKSVTFGRIYV